MDSQIDDLFFNNISQLSNEPNNNNKVNTEEEITTNDKMKSKLPLIILGCTLILILFKK
jgi:hypothetical protein